MSRSRRRRLRLGVAMLSAAALAVVAWRAAPPAPLPPPDGLRVTFLDVGQGDSTLVQVPEGAVLVDQGPPEARVDQALDRVGVSSLSMIVLTHPQRDHVGGAEDVLRSTSVGLVLDPRLEATVEDEDRAMRIVRRLGTPLEVARSGLEYTIGDLRVRVLWPDGPGLPSEDPNDRAVVLMLSYGATDVLLAADAESNVLLGLRLPTVEVLKVSHHGSEDAGLPELLGRLRPRIAVVSVGRDNPYGHPAPETIAALEAQPGLALYRTDRDGRVTVESGGHDLRVATDE